MYKKSAWILALALLVALAVTACVRPASEGPVAEPTATGELPFPVETQDIMKSIATQTAMAAGAQPEAPAETPAPTEGEQPTAEAPAAEATPEAAVEPTATTAPVVVAQPTPALTRPETYTLQAGEWPLCIARRYDLDVEAMLSLNGLGMNSKPAMGAVLKIPTTGTWNAERWGSRDLKTRPTGYTVVQGDTIYSIACAYGSVSPEAILAVNGLSSATDVKAGQLLQIP